MAGKKGITILQNQGSRKKLSLRVTEYLYEEINNRAKQMNISVNEWIVRQLQLVITPEGEI